MDAYKVWSMSCDKKRCNYTVEYEARVNAVSRREAVEQVKGEYRRTCGVPGAGRLNWMAIKLP